MNTRVSTQSQVPRLRISLPLIIAGILLTGTFAQAPDVVFARNQTVLPGDGSTNLPILIDDVLVADDVTSVDIVIQYDNDVVQAQLPIITTGMEMSAANNWFTAANIVPDVLPDGIYELRVSGASSSALGNISGLTALFEIQFLTVDTTVPLSTAVTFDEAELNEAMVSVNVTNGSISLGGSDGAVDLTPKNLIAGNPFTLTLTDLDLIGVVDNADGFIAVELGKTTAGAPFNAGIQLTISDLTTTTGIASTDFTDLRLYRSTDASLDGTDTFMAFASPVNIGSITDLDATGAGASRLVPEAGSIFCIVSARIAGTATADHAFRAGAAALHIGIEESGVGSSPGVVGNQVLADNANHIVIGGGPAKTTDGAAVTIPFGGEKAMLFLLIGSGAYALRRRT